MLLSPAPLPVGGGTCRWLREDAPFLADYYQLVSLSNNCEAYMDNIQSPDLQVLLTT